VTWPIVYEFLRVTTHRAVLPSPLSLLDAWAWIGALMETPSCQVLLPTQVHGAVLEEVLDTTTGLAGNVLHDVHTATLMREHGIGRILTLDTDFHRFEFLDVLDPLAR
jgi:hypothetical protein